MISDTKEWVDFLCEIKISANQYLICMLVYHKDSPSTIKYYNENSKNLFTYEEVNDLVDREYLLRLSKDKNDNLDYFAVTAKFMRDFIIDEDDAGDEFWNAYPSWIYMNSRKVSAKSCDKDELVSKYWTKIKGSKKRHQKVMETLRLYSEKNDGYALMGIDKFVGSEQWTILQKEYEDNSGSGDLIQDI